MDSAQANSDLIEGLYQQSLPPGRLLYRHFNRKLEMRKAKLRSWWKQRRSVYVYIDGVDFQHHIPDDFYGIRIYFSPESLKKHNECWEECGIVKIRLGGKKVKWVEKQKGFSQR